MSQIKSSRREFGVMMAGGVLTAGAVVATAAPVEAYQGNMERAQSSLYQALAELRESTANKGGHRAKAMDLVRQAITEVEAGIEYADERGGGGR